MAKTGKTRTESYPARSYEIDVLVCDIPGCGGDATNRTPCSQCRRDLCYRHQLEADICVGRNHFDKAISNIYCKFCLIQEIEKL